MSKIAGIRPIGKRNTFSLTQELRAYLERNPKERELLIQSLIRFAKQTVKGTSELWDRLEGLPTQRVELSGTLPVTLRFVPMLSGESVTNDLIEGKAVELDEAGSEVASGEQLGLIDDVSPQKFLPNPGSVENDEIEVTAPVDVEPEIKPANRPSRRSRTSSGALSKKVQVNQKPWHPITPDELEHGREEETWNPIIQTSDRTRLDSPSYSSTKLERGS